MLSQFFAGASAGVAVLLATVLTLAQASIPLCLPSIRRSSLLLTDRRCTVLRYRDRMAAAPSGCSTGS
jgi:hypothetical protein